MSVEKMVVVPSTTVLPRMVDNSPVDFEGRAIDDSVDSSVAVANTGRVGVAVTTSVFVSNRLFTIVESPI